LLALLSCELLDDELLLCELDDELSSCDEDDEDELESS
jgi:hypothetical protein